MRFPVKKTVLVTAALASAMAGAGAIPALASGGGRAAGIEYYDVTATTDARGTFTFVFERPLEQVVVSPDQPQNLVGASAARTGQRTVRVRVFAVGRDGRVHPAANQQVTVTLVGLP